MAKKIATATAPETVTVTPEFEFEGMEFVHLIALRERLNEEIANKRERQAQMVRQRAAEMAEEMGLNFNEIFGSRGSRTASSRPAPIKYRNPEDPNQTWAGRGRKPGWLAEAIEEGRDLEEFSIESSEEDTDTEDARA